MKSDENSVKRLFVKVWARLGRQCWQIIPDKPENIQKVVEWYTWRGWIVITIKLFFKRERLGLPGMSSGRKPSPSYVLGNNRREQCCQGPVKDRDPEQGIPARAADIGRLSHPPTVALKQRKWLVGGSTTTFLLGCAPVLQSPVGASRWTNSALARKGRGPGGRPHRRQLPRAQSRSQAVEDGLAGRD